MSYLLSHSLQYTLFLVAIATFSCSTDSQTKAPLDGASASDTNNLIDMSDLRDSDQKAPCDPNCHWDCFGGPPVCENDEVWSIAFAPAPCCHYEDPWPYAGPICGSTTLLQCIDGCVSSIDNRYAKCFSYRKIYSDSPLAEIARLFCEDTASRDIGSACQTDADCRPAKETVSGRLICDLTTNLCKEDARPTLEGYGGSCGTFTPPTTDGIVDLDDGVICVVKRDDTNNCWKQAKTLPCIFDEDCPIGSVCLCDSKLSDNFSICGPENTDGSRTLNEDWLTCPK